MSRKEQRLGNNELFIEDRACPHRIAEPQMRTTTDKCLYMDVFMLVINGRDCGWDSDFDRKY